MTAPAFVAVTTAGDSNGTSLAFTRASTTTNHVNVIDFYLEGGAATGPTFNNGTWALFTMGTGANPQVNADSTPDMYHYRWYEVYAGAGSACTVSWTGGAFWRSLVCDAYSGVDTTTVPDTNGTMAASVGSSTSATAPDLTVVTADALVVWGETDYDGRNVTPPGGTPTFNERTDFANLAVADAVYTAAGATGAKTGTVSGGGSINTAGMIVLRPAVPGGAAQDTPELRGRPRGLRGDRHMRQILAQ